MTDFRNFIKDFLSFGDGLGLGTAEPCTPQEVPAIDPWESHRSGVLQCGYFAAVVVDIVVFPRQIASRGAFVTQAQNSGQPIQPA